MLIIIEENVFCVLEFKQDPYIKIETTVYSVFPFVFSHIWDKHTLTTLEDDVHRACAVPHSFCWLHLLLLNFFVMPVTAVFYVLFSVAVGVPGGECSQWMWLHWGTLQRPAAAPAGLWALSLQCTGFSLQPVWAAGTWQWQGDRQLCPQSLWSLLPSVQ